MARTLSTSGTNGVVHFGYVIYVRLIERRSVHELSWKKAPQDLAIGFAGGTTGVGVIVGFIWVLGHYQVVGTGGLALLLVPIIVTAATVYTEEIMVRGVLFRLLEEGMGSWIALGISALLFGLLHLGNDDATMIGVISIAANAGLLIAGVYMLTRRLWLSIAIHFAVNWTQGAVFGLPVSGNAREGVLQGTLSGPRLLTGGSFGIEASLLMLVLGASAAIYVLNRAYRAGQFIPPPWSRRRNSDRGA